MRFLLDHDVPDKAAQLLRYWGHDVEKLRDTLPITTTDEAVFAHAQQARRVILSCTSVAIETISQRCPEGNRTASAVCRFDYPDPPPDPASRVCAPAFTLEADAGDRLDR